MKPAAPLLAFASLFAAGLAVAQEAPNVEAVSNDGVRYFNSDDIPTYKIAEDGTVDWPTFSGYRRYHSDCHVCHGPDGEGSTYAPALKNSLKTMNYGDFLGVIASGRKNVSSSQESVMPAFGSNQNVACYMDDLFVYLRARANDALGRVRPAKREAKPEAYTKAEETCIGKE